MRRQTPSNYVEKMITNQIKSNSIYVSQMLLTCFDMSIAVAKKTSIDKRLFVQFITAVRQTKASSRVANGNVTVSHFEVGK